MKKTNKNPLKIYYILNNHNWDISLCGELLHKIIFYLVRKYKI